MSTIQYCTKCGKRLEKGARFCGSCGTAVIDKNRPKPARRKKGQNNAVYGLILIVGGILLLAGLYLSQRETAEVAATPAVVNNAGSASSPTSRISVSDTRALLESGEAVVVDVRSTQDYGQGHIPGAISMPLDEVPVRYEELPPDKEIITYCT